MDSIILDIIRTFDSKSKTTNSKYKDFLLYVNNTFDDKINSCRIEKLKNKYKKIKLNVLKYIVVNEKEIISKICKNK